MRKVLSLLIVFLFIFSLTACQSASESIVGVWQTPVTVVGDTGDQLIDTNYILLDFREDGSGALTDMSVYEITPIEFSYTVEGNNLIVESESGDKAEATFEISGDSLTIIYNNREVVYTKY